jgi:hypothetical protein
MVLQGSSGQTLPLGLALNARGDGVTAWENGAEELWARALASDDGNLGQPLRDRGCPLKASWRTDSRLRQAGGGLVHRLRSKRDRVRCERMAMEFPRS